MHIHVFIHKLSTLSTSNHNAILKVSWFSSHQFTTLSHIYNHDYRTTNGLSLSSWLPTHCDRWDIRQELGQRLWRSVSHQEHMSGDSGGTVVQVRVCSLSGRRVPAFQVRRSMWLLWLWKVSKYSFFFSQNKNWYKPLNWYKLYFKCVTWTECKKWNKLWF